jgi:hypothetical protein
MLSFEQRVFGGQRVLFSKSDITRELAMGHYLVLFLLFFAGACQEQDSQFELPDNKPTQVQVSGIYPHLAYYNEEGECGTGAVVPWADRLWVVTYSPHKPLGSSDKLYEITPDLRQIAREESIGGTPANRMIHLESEQLFIGPHIISKEGQVRTIPYRVMPGRHTGNARHLFDPAHKIYYATMEEGFYEVDVSTLEVTMLYRDGNREEQRVDHDPTDVNPENATLPGAHGKGLYSGQGVLVYSNNGEATPEALKKFDIQSGALAEWNGKDWKLVRRNQFVEVTGPGGIYGNPNPATDPIWATGFDHKSLLLGVRDPMGWNFYRLPKASHSYDGAHGWNTEWPRIRNIGTAAVPDYLMTMHGLFWHFPGTFTAVNSVGIRPRSAYLKVIGDFARWNDQLVFGCDDSAQREFLNKRKHKGNIEGPGQSNSNLWFTGVDKPNQLGPSTASGAIWLHEKVAGNSYSEPFLFAGWTKRIAWVHHEGNSPIKMVFEVDTKGNGEWEELKTVDIDAGSDLMVDFRAGDRGEWIRASPNQLSTLTLSFHYADSDDRDPVADAIFQGLAAVKQNTSIGGLLYGLGDNRRSLGVSAVRFNGDQTDPTGYYELDQQLKLLPKKDITTDQFIQEKFAIPKNVVSIEASSVLVIDDQGRRWRLPRGSGDFDALTHAGVLRICREVATERDLFNCYGTFYELPAENADGFAKIRPVASHDFRIHDYASYRGMLVMTGIDPDASPSEHLVRSQDGQAAVWVGVIDDLWQLGKPRGSGGPWSGTQVHAGAVSDPYLISHYDQRSLTITQESDGPVTFRIEVEPLGHGPWLLYKEVTVAPGEAFQYQFPDDFQARWIRFVAESPCQVSTFLVYK